MQKYVTTSAYASRNRQLMRLWQSTANWAMSGSTLQSDQLCQDRRHKRPYLPDTLRTIQPHGFSRARPVVVTAGHFDLNEA